MIIGITGGIGSGKSFIGGIFSYKYGLTFVDSDSIVKHTLMYYIPIATQITKTFGEDSYVNGKVNNRKFNDILWNNTDNLNKINNIIVPYLIDYIKDISSRNNKIIFECPIILNTDIHKYVDHTILVKCDLDLRIRRLMERYGDMKLVTNKINSQSFDESKADSTLINNDKIESQIEKLVQRFNI